MKIYNSFTKKVELLDAEYGDTVKMYLCGPTVYDLPHLGHGRSAVNFDFMRKYLELRGYHVRFVSNYTDIDDKMINRANESGITVAELAKKIIPEYVRDYDALGVKMPNARPRATEFVVEMIEMVKKLAEKDIAYKLEDGWYFDIKKFPSYGQLSGQNMDELKAGARVEQVKGKRNPQDFVLWKFKKDGEPAWMNEVLGEGRPGWHIECSAMIHSVFGGEAIDIHGGGEDLRFPHHECEIAQSLSCFPGEFVKKWVHNAFVMVNNEKMSKSLNNFTTLRDLFKTIDPQTVRFFYLQNHYRSPIDFHDEALEQAKNGLARLHNFYEAIKFYEEYSDQENAVQQALDKTENNLIECLNEDFETGKAVTALFGLISDIAGDNKKMHLSKSEKQHILDFWKKWDQIFGFLIPQREAFLVKNSLIDFDEKEVENAKANFAMHNRDLEWLVAARLAARRNKNFPASDQIRDFLKDRKIILEDAKNGTIVKYQ